MSEITLKIKFKFDNLFGENESPKSENDWCAFFMDNFLPENDLGGVLITDYLQFEVSEFIE